MQVEQNLVVAVAHSLSTPAGDADRASREAAVASLLAQVPEALALLAGDAAALTAQRQAEALAALSRLQALLLQAAYWLCKSCVHNVRAATHGAHAGNGITQDINHLLMAVTCD